MVFVAHAAEAIALHARIVIPTNCLSFNAIRFLPTGFSVDVSWRICCIRYTFDSRLFREALMIRKLSSGMYRLYSQKRDPKTGKRRNLGTFGSRAAAEKHERAVQFFKRRG
jgi:hypothetical protein